MSPTDPAVSVVMSVYNGAATLDEAINSIRQQAFTAFEFIVIDDGSTDATPSILARHAADDPRLRVVTQANRGLTRSLNRGVSLARAPLIARQDADDISRPERLARQVARMAERPDVLLLGTASMERDMAGVDHASQRDASRLARLVYLHNPFAHTSVMFRKATFDALGGYDESFDTSQDFELWMRFAEQGAIDMLTDVLVIRRQQPNSISSRKRVRQYRNGLRARLMHPHAGRLPAIAATAYQVLSNSAPDWLVSAVRRARRRAVTSAPGPSVSDNPRNP